MPPSITTQPVNKSVAIGETTKFSVRATGAAPLSYQWRKNAVNIVGATSFSYTIPPATAQDDGSLFSVVVSNIAGSVTSVNAKLTVKLPPTIADPAGEQDSESGQDGEV